VTGLGWFKNLRRGSSCEETGGKSPRVGRASVEAWGAQEVGTWLTALGLTEYKYVQIFRFLIIQIYNLEVFCNSKMSSGFITRLKIQIYSVVLFLPM
jgi:hypothetical protein